MSCIATLCTFCYRREKDKGLISVSKTERLKCKRKKKEILIRFLKLTERYFGSSFQLGSGIKRSDGDEIGLEACSDCYSEVESFCKLYHEWKCLEMELEWRLNKLRRGNESTKREERYHEIDEEGMQLLRNFRSEFQQKCSKKFSLLFPRVTLERMVYPPTKREVNDVQSLENINILPNQLFFGWISTFVVVLLLGSWFLEPNGTRHVTGDHKPIIFSSSDSYVEDNYEDVNEDTLCNEDGNTEYPFADQFASLPKLISSASDSSRKLETKSTPLPITEKIHIGKRNIRSFQACSSQSQPVMKPRHKTIRRNAAVSSSPFRCFCCRRNFNSFPTLLQHRRAFTHVLAKKLKHLRKPKQQKHSKRIKIQHDSLSRQHHYRYNDDLNVGVLRRLPSRKQNAVMNNIKKENTSDEESSKGKPDYDDNDEDWSCSSSTETSSCSSSSDDNGDGNGNGFKHQFTLEKHKKECHPKSAETMKKFVCEQGKCRKHFEFEEELEIHKKHHGNFPCQFCRVIKTYAPYLALHERVHAKTKAETDKEKYHCVRCGFKASDKFAYINHCLHKHYKLPVQRVMCPVCKILYSKTSYLRHYKLFHETEGVDPASIQKCEKCAAYFLKESQLSEHFKNAHNPNRSLSMIPPSSTSTVRNRIPCDVSRDCRKTFQNEKELENHRKLHGKFTCSLCPNEEKYAPNLALHEATHFVNTFETTSPKLAKAYKCSRCPVTIPTKTTFISHFLEKHLNLSSDVVTCQNCGEKFSVFSRELASHIRTKHNTEGMREQDIARCDQCPAFFSEKRFIFHHKKRMHFVEDNITCLDCERKFATPNGLRKHRIKIHKKKEAEFPLLCDVSGCERRFEREIDLGWHKNQMHESKTENRFNTFVCHECGKNCPTKAAFTYHMRVHGATPPVKKKDRKRYVCEECGKVFTAQVFLKTHQLSHSGPASWKYDCLFCGKKSATNDKLKEHIRMHTNEKPYICEYCGAEYADGRNWRNHRNLKHDANDFLKKRNVVNGYVSKKGQKLPPRWRK